MRIELIELEKTILDNELYLTRYYQNIEILISGIGTILDFGMSNETIEKFFTLNRVSIHKINELLKNRRDEKFDIMEAQ